ncbi:SAICAR synthase-like protein [Ascobolus immersus RN42]|uniref:Kinase n=1 Tax=Ascobolus immersus RN42 TaxID=1160509 RepID=A0A3N4IMW6_ASCIM|nr:SAICAR synthase-like protein [Ascobolus immersus RN42]
MSIPANLTADSLTAFSNAAAGHDGVLSDPSGTLLIKPCTPRELAFYESLHLHPTLAPYVPAFLGTLAPSTPADIPPEAAAEATSLSEAVAAQPNHNRNLLIVLENLTAPFEHPTILDLKLGAQLWDDEASLEKRKRLDDVANATTSGSLGYRIAGMKVWDPITSSYKVYDKMYGRQFNESDIIKGVEDFFAGLGDETELKIKLAERFLSTASGVREVLEKEESRMYSASLLFVFEGGAKELREALEQEAILDEERRKKQEARRASGIDTDDEEVDDDEEEEDDDVPRKGVENCKLIDFAHASWTPGQGPDENLLRGVRNVEKLFGEFLEKQKAKLAA